MARDETGGRAAAPGEEVVATKAAATVVILTGMTTAEGTSRAEMKGAKTGNMAGRKKREKNRTIGTTGLAPRSRASSRQAPEPEGTSKRG
jgi:hypothetical protein